MGDGAQCEKQNKEKTTVWAGSDPGDQSPPKPH